MKKKKKKERKKHEAIEVFNKLDREACSAHEEEPNLLKKWYCQRRRERNFKFTFRIATSPVLEIKKSL